MSISREAFLERVRQAVVQGNRAGVAASPAARGAVGYQGAGADPVGRFRDELTAAGGHCHVVPDADAAVNVLIGLLKAGSVRRALLGGGARLDALDLSRRLRAHDVEVVHVDSLPQEKARESFFAADAGISGAEALVAETGSIAVAVCRQNPRSLSLLPPVHIAIAWRDQLLPDLFDLFARFTGEAGPSQTLPSSLTLITGPSKTGDIELRLVTGVHGPGEVHVVLVTG